MKRREFIAGLGGAVAWPLAARAQRSRMPAVGVFGTIVPEFAGPFQNGLYDSGYIIGRNVTVEYRRGQLNSDLPRLAAELVQRQVDVIVAVPTPAAVAAKAATKLIPIVFIIAADPVEIGLVANLSQPGGNLTGVSSLNDAVAAKRLELLHEIVPTARLIGFLVNPSNHVDAESEIKELQVAAQTLGLRLLIVNASDQSEFETAFVTLVRERADGLLVGADAIFFNSDHIIALAARYRIPVMYRSREATAGGGLMSYATDYPEVWRLTGGYTARILKGERPAEMPVQLATKMQLVINTKTAKVLGLTFPLALLGRADEVIE
jgi:putative ABC transport system substrate-binding protein